MAEDGGLLTDEVREMAADALFDELPTKRATHLRSVSRKVESVESLDWRQEGTWEGRLRQKRQPVEQTVGEQTREVQAWEFVMRPYPAAAQDWRKIKSGDRLQIEGQLFSVEGTASTSALVQTIQLAMVEGAAQDQGV